MLVQVYHTNHKTTDTAYYNPTCKSGADTNRAGVSGGTHQPEKNCCTSCKNGPRRDSQPGRGRCVTAYVYTNRGTTPAGVVNPLWQGGAVLVPPTAPGHSPPVWWLVAMVHSTPRPGSRERKKDTDTQKHIVVSPGSRCRGFVSSHCGNTATGQKCRFWWVLSGCGSRL